MSLIKYSSLEKERPLAFITHSNSEESDWKNIKFIQNYLSSNFIPIIVISFLTESQIAFAKSVSSALGNSVHINFIQDEDNSLLKYDHFHTQK